MTNRYERLKMHRAMQRRIRLVVEERRMAFAAREPEPTVDLETTMEIPPPALLPQRAVGRVVIQSA
ncbi:hypothetical protein ACQP2E_34815 [Actinoplanes sp. CA-015351]|uniref:hypothetical protein n=1 Tax=Actinoplanes sp. CA-015351 TaxID=3239897 RepID=UPI003D98B26B